MQPFLSPLVVSQAEGTNGISTRAPQAQRYNSPLKVALTTSSLLGAAPAAAAEDAVDASPCRKESRRTSRDISRETTTNVRLHFWKLKCLLLLCIPWKSASFSFYYEGSSKNKVDRQ